MTHRLILPFFSVLLLGVLFLTSCAHHQSSPLAEAGPLFISPQEVQNIKQAWQKQSGKDYKLLKSIVDRAEENLQTPIAFPRSGSQHSQWYQCPKCEYGLKTLSATRHKCNLCSKIYSGYPYDECVFKYDHGRNFWKMYTCAQAYLITGDKNYANYVKDMLIGYAERYKKYPHHNSQTPATGKSTKAGAHIYEQTLDEASVAASRIAPAYDMVRPSGVFSQTDVQKLKVGLVLPMLENIANNESKNGKSNWQTWHNAAMISLGVAFDEPAWVDRGINKPGKGFYYQMEHSVTEDGFWYEGSTSYHFYALSALVCSAEAAKGQDLDLWQSPALRKMIVTPIFYKMPDGTLPCFADSIRKKLRIRPFISESAWAAFKPAALKSALPTTPSWESIKFGRNLENFSKNSKSELKSALFKATGHAILRDSGPKGLVAALSFAPYQGFHSHYDMLSFVFFGLGRELCVDPGRAKKQAYRLEIHKQWYKGTLSHNAILVDYLPQKRSSSSNLLFFKSAKECTYSAAETTSAYPGVRQTRLLALTNDYLLTFDLLDSQKPVTFSWTCHINGQQVNSPPEVRNSNIAKLGPGFQYIKNSKRGQAKNLVKFEIPDDGLSTFLTVSSPGKLKFITGDGPKESVLQRVPLAMVSNADKLSTTSFASVIEPVKQGCSPVVKTISVQKQGSINKIIITRQNGIDLFYFDKQKGLTWELTD